MSLFFAIALPVLILFCGLTLDVGRAELLKIQMQSASDAAAIGAELESERGVAGGSFGSVGGSWDWMAQGKQDAAIQRLYGRRERGYRLRGAESNHRPVCRPVRCHPGNDLEELQHDLYGGVARRYLDPDHAERRAGAAVRLLSRRSLRELQLHLSGCERLAQRDLPGLRQQ